MNVTFPVGFHQLHKNKLFNFQLNRWYSFGVARLEDLQSIAKNIKDFQSWKNQFIYLAELAANEKRLINAAFYYRAADFFTFPSDPDKNILYDKFQTLFYTEIKNLEQHRIPYKTGFLHAFRISPPQDTKGTIVIHGGFDSYIEEFYLMAQYLANAGFEVIGFEGPGQGAVLKKYGIALQNNWEVPTKAILDYFKINNTTILGISMGGWWCLRAAAFEPRIKRVIASSVVFDWMGVPSKKLKKLIDWLFAHPKIFNWAVKKKIEMVPYNKWIASNWMYITKEESVMNIIPHILEMNRENLHSEKVTQDVLILTGDADEFVPVKMHYQQIQALKNVKSIEGKIFTKSDQANHHCQIGNFGLACDTIIKWIEAHT